MIPWAPDARLRTPPLDGFGTVGYLVSANQALRSKLSIVAPVVGEPLDAGADNWDQSDGTLEMGRNAGARFSCAVPYMMRVKLKCDIWFFLLPQRAALS